MRRVRRLVTEHAVDGEELGGLEAAGLVCNLVQHRSRH